MHALKEDFAVKRMARLLHISTSGHYKWCQRQVEGPSPRAAAQCEGERRVDKVHEDSQCIHGAPRVTAQLEREGIRADPKTVADSMRRQGIEGVSPRRLTPVTTIPGVPTYHLPDRVHRKWDQGRLDAVWISDINYSADR